MFEWIFLVSIELINNPKPVQIIFSLSIGKNRGSKYLNQKLNHNDKFWSQKLIYYVSIRGQKSADPFSLFLAPETV